MATQTGGGDPKKITAAFQEAVRLAPDRAENWAGLADALDLAGDESSARTAYKRAINLYPRSPAINWQFANFLVRQGNISDAAEPLRRAIEGDSSLRMGAFDLAWRPGMPAQAILGIVPPMQQDGAAYLDYLTGSKRLDPAAQVWKLLLAAPAPFSLDSAFRYFDALLAAHRVEEIDAMWAGLARHDPGKIHWQPETAQRITNGGFDAPLLGGGFGWRLMTVSGADMSLDPLVFHDAAPSLCIEFEGRRDLDFGNVVEYATAEPDTKYDFTAFTRTEWITTDSRPRIAVDDPLDHSALWSQTPELTGTNSWQEQDLQFRTGPRTRIVTVQVVRAPSQKFDNLINGTMWLDDVSLKAIP